MSKKDTDDGMTDSLLSSTPTDLASQTSPSSSSQSIKDSDGSISKSPSTSSTHPPPPYTPPYTLNIPNDTKLLSTAHDDEEEDLDKVLIPLPPIRFYLVFTAILLILFLSQLDTSIVSTALKAIVTDLGEAPMIPWIGSSYLLTCTASAALYGRLSDVFGRKPVILFAIAVFSGGSVICSYCKSMEVLIVGRAVAGVGGGGIATMMFIVISDIVSLRYRTWFQGLANTTSGIAAMVGPVVGGVLSDKLSWRWCFLVNIPLGAIAFFILAFCVSFPSPRGNILTKLRRLDWLGMILLTGCVVCFVTPLQLGGTFWEWDEPNSVGMFVGAGVLLMVFVVVEWKVAEEPFVPGDLFVNKGVAAMFAVAGGLGFTYFAVPYYISLFFQMCYGSSAIKAGIQSIPLVLGSTLSSLGGGYYISHSGRFVLLIYIGSILQFTGILLITFLSPHSPLWMQIIYLFIAGLGLGFIVCSRLIGVQVIVKTSHVAMVTGLSQFFRLLGGTLGIAVTGTIFNNMIESSITSRRSLDRHVMHILRNTSDPREARRMLNYVALRLELPTPHLVDQLVDAFLEAFRWGYRVMLVWPVVTVVLVVVFVRRQRMRGFERLGR